MNKIFSTTLLFFSLIFTTFLNANDTFKGIGKQDVNVRIKPDYNSTIVYVLRKNQEVDIKAIVKTKNKGTWYKIDRGYVVTRFVNTEAKDIPTEDFNVKVLQDDSTQKEEVSVKLPKEIKTQEVKEEVKKELDKPIEEEITQEKQEEVLDIIEKKDNIQTIDSNKEEIKEKTEEKTFIEPKVIKNDESSLLKYINLSYVLYALIAIVVFILLIVLIKKIFSRPSITDQISEHKRRSDSLKKALSNEKEE